VLTPQAGGILIGAGGMTVERTLDDYLKVAHVVQGRNPESLMGTELGKVVEKANDALVEALARDPYAVRVLKRNRRATEDELDKQGLTPADAIGYQRLEAWLMLTRPEQYVALGLEHAPDLWQIAATGLLVLQAAPFLWKRDILHLAWSLPLPRHTVTTSTIPHHQMLWILERPWHLSEEGGGSIGSVHFWLLSKMPGSVRITMIGTSDQHERTLMIYVTDIHDGARYPEDVPGVLGQILSMLSFINSPFVDHRPQRLPRGSKAGRRAGRVAEIPPAISVVQLRAETKAQIANVTAHHQTSYDHRWIVRGHHRAQWYPSLQAHKVIWIAPYVKGPEDLPLKTPIYSVNR
jgi:hypothetical protein